jgi:hypothetical protein
MNYITVKKLEQDNHAEKQKEKQRKKSKKITAT